MDKRKSKSTTAQYIAIPVLAIIIALMLLYIFMRSKLNTDITFAPDLTVTDNPLMGFAPDATNTELCEEANLVFIEISWKDFEKEDGVFDFEGIEKKYNISKWKSENKHAVLRFVCDIPGQYDHYDIPKWLYDKTGDGTHYDSELGKGYSPNYSNEVFKKYHKRAIEALAEYCNKDHFVSFVELGSIGHWGEWHAADANGKNLMPGADVCFEYATLYSENFVNACLLTRRNYDFSVDGNIGIYNDMVGAEEDTKEWLEWIKQGDIQETGGESLVLKKTELGKKFPVGGEFTSSVPMSQIMKKDLGDNLALISSSKMTFIGPMVPDLTSEEYAMACDSVLRRMGYRIYVSGLKTQYNFSSNEIKLTLKFQNAGNAGFFFDWPVTVHVYDKDLNEVYWEGLQVDLRQLNSVEEISSESNIPVSGDLMNEYYIGVSITDYDGNDRIILAIDQDDERVFVDNTQIIYHYKKGEK